MNLVILMGNLGKDAEMRKDFLTFSLATTKNIKKGEEWTKVTDWHSVTVTKPNDFLKNELLKGAKVVVEGSLTYNKTEARTYTNIIANKVHIVKKVNEQEKELIVKVNDTQDSPY
jgi:single stranded DNA-binding protein